MKLIEIESFKLPAFIARIILLALIILLIINFNFDKVAFSIFIFILIILFLLISHRKLVVYEDRFEIHRERLLKALSSVDVLNLETIEAIEYLKSHYNPFSVGYTILGLFFVHNPSRLAEIKIKFRTSREDIHLIVLSSKNKMKEAIDIINNRLEIINKKGPNS